MNTVEHAVRAKTQKWVAFWFRTFITLLVGWCISFPASLLLTGTQEDVAMWVMTGCTFGILFAYWKMRGHEIKLEQMNNEESK